MGRNSRSRSSSFRSNSMDETLGAVSVPVLKRKDSSASQQQLQAGSAATATATATTTTTIRSSKKDAAKELFQILWAMNTHGQSLLHHACRDDRLLPLAYRLLQRLEQLNDHDESNNNDDNNNDDSDLKNRFLRGQDVENGYTPLHWAIQQGHLPMILMLLRHPQPRFMSQRPIELLLSSNPTTYSNSNNSSNNITDHEGWTPAQLMAKLQTKTLADCRASIARPTVQERTLRRSSRSNSFLDTVEQDQDDEFALLRQGQQLLQEDPTSLEEVLAQSLKSATKTKFGCEVLTFGRSGNCALGTSFTTTNHSKHRPQRVATFALADSSGAVHVAAAAHHTLVVTKDGDLYGFGIGKGGRLGTGHEKSLPQPTRIMALSKRRVVYCAAAENHSLCCTSDGHVYAWGSNRFGQIGSSNVLHTTPKRVEEIRSVHCIAVAAGEKHSVALTRDGQVYTWGDNSSGQLGRRRHHNNKGVVERVEALWNTQKVTLAIAASEHSTLALVQAPTTGIHQAVYSWGHGNPVPTRVQFEDANVNPIALASAKYHNAVVTKDGSVYTWGFHAESLGNHSGGSRGGGVAKKVVLPEQAVAVSASEHHTAVVTAQGHLFTWGATFNKNVMGHEGVRYQPSPKRVEGVHRAVGVAVAKEHTVLMMGTAFPSFPEAPNDVVLSLEYSAARKVVEHIDLFNVIPIAVLADSNQSWWLQDYCRRFIQMNLDGVLLLGRKSDMDLYLNSCLAEPDPRLEPDDALVHPLMEQVLMQGVHDTQEWLSDCRDLLANLPVATKVKYQQQQQEGSWSGGRRRRRDKSFHELQQQRQQQQQTARLETGVQGCSERCLMLTVGVENLELERDILSKHSCLSKEIRGIRKRLGQIAKLETKQTVGVEERNKLARKPLLEADLKNLDQAMTKLERIMNQRNLVSPKTVSAAKVSDKETNGTKNENKNHTKDDDNSKLAAIEESQTDKAEQLQQQQQQEALYCKVCGIKCPDANSLALHTNGRKHRNRVLQSEKSQEQATAATLEQNKLASSRLPATTKPPASPCKTDPVQPKYKLAPPPHQLTAPVVAMSWAKLSSTATPVSADFRSILAEQESKQKAKKKQPQQQSPLSKSPATPSHQSPPLRAPVLKSPGLLSPGPVAPLKAAPWMTSPVAHVPVVSLSPTKATPPTRIAPSSTPASPGKKVSLAEFMASPPRTESPVVKKAAAWSCPQVSSKNSTPDVVATASLADIQKEEEALRTNQAQNLASDGKWFIERRERIGSFSTILEEEAKKEQEMQRLMEEQRRIEQEIQRQQQSKPKKKNKKKQTNNNSSKGRKNSNNKGKGKYPNRANATRKQKQHHESVQ